MDYSIITNNVEEDYTVDYNEYFRNLEYFQHKYKDKIIIKKGIEINTSSFRYKLPDLTHSSYILKRYLELGGEIITTGSDSHNSAQVTHEFKRIYENLKDMGYKYICTFDKMKPNFINL